MKTLLTLLIGLLLGCAGTLLVSHYWGNSPTEYTPNLRSFTYDAARSLSLSSRNATLAAYPELLPPLMEGFGGEFSRSIAQNIFADTPEGVEDAINMSYVERIDKRTWMLRMPLVNAILFETSAGLVLVDTGTKAAGLALLDMIKDISNKPLHTIIYTHGHVDHAFGSHTLVKAYPKVQIVAQKNIVNRFERYMETRGLLARLMSQPAEQIPNSRQDFVWPTQTFDQQLSLTIGDEIFELHHYPAETDDQLFVWLPNRFVLASADFYQGFLPNAGNGKRVQRYVKEWADALKAMAELKPKVLLPSHGTAIQDTKQIQDKLLGLAAALTHIRNHVIEALNGGSRRDQAWQNIKLPAQLASREDLRHQYVTAQDIGKMVAKRYTGWWNDLPSGWRSAPLTEQAQDLMDLSSSADEVLSKIDQLIDNQAYQRAAHLVDWYNLAYPADPRGWQQTIAVYRARLLSPTSPTQERLVYLDTISFALAQIATPSE